ncbi:PolC-type DNA polymerase III [Pseudolactococcus paracarnosus]|uniref:DNA polymerase III PolC-type n=1 Tax=Pseudolactococcus paracarnosus TaxID=2749962 RepID=A0ABT0ALD1_9LACT|nr:PolC-type DNA polymerase III [Lactococcus paracarnosus]MCJ1977359.1 PolC-type DNA polymerase III [Lactococcus paracarnosus]MCJ1983513.1 PolC-type DNA polymerase III [Lactococcus paracarnosus]MCJ1997849.1 PolC-type DNA polymerase III [Lactococcus paracarnosus]
MNELFDKLMDQLEMPVEIRNNPVFKGNIEKVEVHAVSKIWHFYLAFPAILPIGLYKELVYRLEMAFSNIAKTELTIITTDARYDEALLNDYLPTIFEQPGCDTPSFTAIFKKYKFIAGEQATDAQLLVGELSNLTYFVTHYFPVMEKHYHGFGFTDLHITPKIDYELTDRLVAEYEKKSEAALADILANQPEPSFSNEPAFPTAKEETLSPTHLALGKEIKATDTVFQMQDVVNEEANVVFEGYVFAAEHKVFKNRTTGKESHMLEVKMTDYSSSFIIQKWGRKPEEQAMFDLVKKGMWLKVKGSVQMDQYKHELVMSVRDMVEIKAKNIRKDLMPDDQKRVEFHAHTNMSTMDAITDVSDLVAQAARWGHEAIAITDHAGAQSFPHAHSAGKKNGVKILYGIEANLVEDRVPITYNEDDSNLSDATYVVFDVETTGLSAVYNKLIQVAASKMHKGNVIEQFDEFIDPGHPVSEFTTQLTGITDDMVRGSKPLEEVLVAFQAFCQGSILVAHNATFDVGFMNINYQRYDLPIITQPVIDTLEFARNLYPEIKRHGLGPLTKRFQVSLENHHLANFDAEATGRLLFIFLNDAKEKFKITLLSDLNTKVVDENSYKRARVKHATIYAKTQAGLKNLFKLISFSNVNYFAGVPRIPKSVLETYRDGLIIGSACSEGEVFEAVTNKSFDDALKIADYYDFIEIMPPAVYRPLIAKETIKDEVELQRILKDMIKLADTLGKPVLATGNVHYLNPEDAVYREIIVRSMGPGAMINRPVGRGEHAMPAPLPDVHFRTTTEMLDAFAFLGEAVARQIVIENTQKMAASFDVLTPVREDLYTPYIPKSEEKMAKLTYEKSHAIYGNPLPDIVDLRIEKELNSIIGNGFSVIYLISQILVERSNNRGYLVGSRGSVGSSFVATMTGITEVNPLPPHYVCPDCQFSEFFTEGQYGSGFDMPEKNCPNCGQRLKKDGHDIPFETFLGFKGDKVPDIDLNFSGADQPSAHLDVREIFGADYAFRAGTIGTVAEKTAFGFVKGYERDYGHYYRGAEIERLAAGSTGVKRTTGQHPGGIIVIPGYMDVYDFSPVAFPAEDVNAEWQTTHFDFHAIHDNILKLDILGHDDPTMIRKLQDLSGMDASTIPMDDPDVMKIFAGTEVLGVTPEQIFSKTGTLGVPEMGTTFVRGMLEETKPSTFAELLQISGLSHGTDVWLGNAQELIKQGIANLAKVIGCRDDIMVYLIHAGLDESMAFTIMERVRKGMWNKMGDEERDAYIAAMRENNVPEWYIDSCSKIKYMFPKAHAAAYIMMALRVAYFKVHMPIYYYCAWFSIRANAFDLKVMGDGLAAVKAKMAEIRGKGFEATNVENALFGTLELCNEMLERGFKFGKLDLYRSEASEFIIEGDTLIPPFSAMDGLGGNVARQLVKAREDGEFLSKTELRKRAGVSQTLVDKMDDMGILGNMPEDNQLSLFDDLF